MRLLLNSHLAVVRTTITYRVYRALHSAEWASTKKVFYSFQHNRLNTATLNYQPYCYRYKGDKITLLITSIRNFSSLYAARKKLANQITQSCGNKDPHFAEKKLQTGEIAFQREIATEQRRVSRSNIFVHKCI